METIGMGNTIGELKQKIAQIQNELTQASNNVELMPELINSANLLRQNEYLSKINEKSTELLSVYELYAKELEKMISSIFEIQNDLKEVLKSQSTLIKTSRNQNKTRVKARKTAHKKK